MQRLKKQEMNSSRAPIASKIKIHHKQYRFTEQIAEKIRLSRDTRLAINQDMKDTNHRCFQAKLTQRTTSNAFGSSFKRQIKDIFQKIYLELWSWITEPKGRSPRTRGERHSKITTGSCANRCRWKLLKNLWFACHNTEFSVVATRGQASFWHNQSRAC